MRTFLVYLGIVILTAVIVVTVHYYHTYQPWMAAHTGSAGGQEAGGEYAYWSGFGSVIPWELGIFISVWVWIITHYRMVNCHVDHCPRLGRYVAAGGHFKVCRRHHPEAHVRNGQVTFEHIQWAHAMHLLRTGVGRLPEKRDGK
jgi:hypothetical protein